MESEIIMKIEMTKKQVDEALFGEVELRKLSLDFATQVLSKEPTPAQAQAVLALAWNEIMQRSRLTARKD